MENTLPTAQQQADAIERIYSHAMAELAKLGSDRSNTIKKYIRELELQKIEAIRASLTESLTKEEVAKNI